MALQDVLTQVAADYEPIMVQYFVDYKASSRKTMEDAGVQYIKLPPEEAEVYMELGYKMGWLETKERTNISQASLDFLKPLLMQ